MLKYSSGENHDWRIINVFITLMLKQFDDFSICKVNNNKSYWVNVVKVFQSGIWVQYLVSTAYVKRKNDWTSSKNNRETTKISEL